MTTTPDSLAPLPDARLGRRRSRRRWRRRNAEVVAVKSPRRNAAKRKKPASRRRCRCRPTCRTAMPKPSRPATSRNSSAAAAREEKPAAPAAWCWAPAPRCCCWRCSRRAWRPSATCWRRAIPGTKPVLAATCAVFGCKVELPAQIDTLSVETGELQSLGANTFSLHHAAAQPGHAGAGLAAHRTGADRRQRQAAGAARVHAGATICRRASPRPKASARAASNRSNCFSS